MVVCEKCGGRRLRSWIVEQSQGRLVITECQSCGNRNSRWFGDPPSEPEPSDSPQKAHFTESCIKNETV